MSNTQAIRKRIDKGIELHKADYEKCNTEIKEYIKKYGDCSSEYIIHRQIRSAYYRGSLETLESLKDNL